MNKKKLESLEIGRGIAALFVVFFHITEIIQLDKYYGYKILNNFWIFGHSGVDFFFVLSGFVIYYSANRLLNSRKNVIRYFKSRFARIYPPYVIICLMLLPFHYFLFHHNLGFSDVLKDIILYPKKTEPFLPVAWSLKNEIFFYFLFSVFFISRKFGWIVFLLWFSGIIVLNFSEKFLNSSPEVALIFSNYNIEFIFGVLISASYLNGKKFKKIFFPIGVTIFFLTGIIEWKYIFFRYTKYYHILFGIGASFAIMGMLEIERKVVLAKSILKDFFLTMGKASYSIYLVHFPFLLGFVRILVKIKFITPHIAATLMAISSVFAGYLYWKFIETPTLNYTKLKLRLK